MYLKVLCYIRVCLALEQTAHLRLRTAHTALTARTLLSHFVSLRDALR